MLNQFSTTLQQSGEGNLGLQERLEMVKKKISSFCFLTMAERFQPNKHDKSTEIEKDSPKTDKKSDNDAQDHTQCHRNPTIFSAK